MKHNPQANRAILGPPLFERLYEFRNIDIGVAVEKSLPAGPPPMIRRSKTITNGIVERTASSPSTTKGRFFTTPKENVIGQGHVVITRSAPAFEGALTQAAQPRCMAHNAADQWGALMSQRLSGRGTCFKMRMNSRN